jgi:hypothetical protein
MAAYARGINRQRAGATDEPFTRAANNIMSAATTDVLDALMGSLNNLALAATSNKTALYQLTVENLALTTTVSTLTIANKKLTITVAIFNLPPTIRGSYAGRGDAFPEPSETITVGHTDTRPSTTARRTGFQVTMCQQR